MDQVVTHVDGIVDDPLDAIVLKPGLTILKVDLVVCPEERIEHAELVHHDPEVLRRLQLVTWDVSTAKWVTSHADREHLVEGAPWLAHESLSVTSPHWSVLLAAEEVGTGQNEGSQMVFGVLGGPAFIGTHVLQGAIGIVNVTVQNIAAILHHMLELDRHGLDRTVEDAGVIHIIPGVEKLICPFKLLELVLPELACVLI